MSPGSEKFGRVARWMLAARPMPALEHAAVPHRDAVRGAEVVQLGSTRRWPPTRPGLMLMMRQAPAAIASRAMRDGVDRLVEADRRRQPPLQRRVVRHIVVVERLLDHHQVERRRAAARCAASSSV